MGWIDSQAGLLASQERLAEWLEGQRPPELVFAEVVRRLPGQELQLD